MSAAAVEGLRTALRRKEETLALVRKRVAAARASASASAASAVSAPSVGDISKRYLNAIADSEDKGIVKAPQTVVRSGEGVSGLAQKWQRGMQGKEVERTAVDVRGDVDGAKKAFNAKDYLTRTDLNASAVGKSTKGKGGGPAELLVEDSEGLPSWAVNQDKKVLRKENARSSVQDVDVKELQGSIVASGKRDGTEAFRESVEVKGDVKSRLAMWSKTADEDTKALVEKKKEEEKRAAIEAEAAADRKRQEVERAQAEIAAKFSRVVSIDDLPKEEPTDIMELAAYLELKIKFVEKDIEKAEDELLELERV